MQEAYEEISGCPEEIMYPILEDIEINSNNTKISSTSSLSETAITNREMNSNVNTRIQEEAFQEANNYVCSEMLDCSWTSNTTENISNDRVSKNVIIWKYTTYFILNTYNKLLQKLI
jgi:hypothetical protein